MNSKHDKLIILDLDEALLHASTKTLDSKAEFVVGPYLIYIRPFAREFIEFCFKQFASVAVWTASTEDYAVEICGKLFGEYYNQLLFLWSRDRCTRKFNPEHYDFTYIKDLKKTKRFGYRLEQIIMVDDTPAKLQRQYSNLVKVAGFLGQQDDHELSLLMQYLPSLASQENIRPVKKRGWRNSIVNSNTLSGRQ